MAPTLDGHVGVVTGGNGGIGLGLARGLAGVGAAVAVWGRDEAKTAAAVKELAALGAEAAGVRCEVADEADVARAMAETLDRFGRVDSFFANAGISGSAAPIHEMSFDEWRRVLTVNVDGTFLTLRAAAVELAPHGIRCNALLPGWTETDMTSPAGAFSKAVYERFADNTTYRTPVKRWASPRRVRGHRRLPGRSPPHVPHRRLTGRRRGLHERRTSRVCDDVTRLRCQAACRSAGPFQGGGASISERLHDAAGRDVPIRVLMAKVGLDGHDRGVRIVARSARRGYGGYLPRPASQLRGLPATPERVWRAIQEVVA